MITEKILSWVPDNQGWKTEDYKVGGSIVTLTIEEKEPPSRHLCNYFQAHCTIDGSRFLIPGTDVMQCFSIIFCKEVCQQYWMDFIQNHIVSSTKMPIPLPPPVVGSINEIAA